MNPRSCPGCSAPLESVAFPEGEGFRCGSCGFEARPLPDTPRSLALSLGAARREPGEAAPELTAPFSAAFRERYELLSVLGAGGMGVVYLARQRGLNRPAAIKMIQTAAPSARARFEREGRLLARLRHPNLLQVYETGEDEGRPYLVMELVEGETLKERVARSGALELSLALDFGRQIASGLGLAHGEGILHRDLKSSNVLVDGAGVAKLCDFGLARDADEDVRLTRVGAIMGTPETMSPEQARGENATTASDEKPVHEVTLAAYSIGKHEVTWGQYRKFCHAKSRSEPEDPGFTVGEDHPVANVSWGDAVAYCEWAGGRLPTEAEWEYAARGTDARKYPWGNEAPDAGGRYRANYGTGNAAADGFENTAPAGSFPGGASPFGVLDMAGNVWEWCADVYDGSYYARSPRHAPKGSYHGANRVLRGGSWNNSAGNLRAAIRYWHSPADRAGVGGFRLAR